MSDLISRGAAIKALDAEFRCTDNSDDWNGLRTAMLIIEELPSAQPEPREVVPHRNYQYLSDYWCQCGWHLGKKGDVKYCPDCGRKVKWDG